jgi:hypothetical protein
MPRGGRTMTPDDVAVLLRVKRAREQRAETALRQAMSAQSRAGKARGRASQAAEDFARQRPEQEAAIYRVLTAGPIPVQLLRQAAAQLSGLVAHAEVLGQRLAQAARHEAACAEVSAAAQAAHAAAIRESLGTAAMGQQVDTAHRVAAEQSRDAELEELTEHRQPASRGGPQL